MLIFVVQTHTHMESVIELLKMTFYPWRHINFKGASPSFDRNPDRNASILNLLKFASICWCAYYLTLSSQYRVFGLLEMHVYKKR